MKNLLFYIFCTLSLFSIFYFSTPVVHQSQNLTFISGQISNPVGDTIRVFNKTHSFITNLNEKGRFELHFNIDSADYFTFFHGVETTSMYIEPGDDIQLEIDTEYFDETIKYVASEESSFLARKYLIEESFFDKSVDVFSISDSDFMNLWSIYIDSVNFILKDISNKKFAKMESNILISDEKMILSRREILKNVPVVGEFAIDFKYLDVNGDSIALSDFKNKYIYVDVWATWCGPCVYQIPFLLNLEEEFRNENIVFLSVSVDSDKNKWLSMIKEKNMTGVQLFASGWESKIMKDYGIFTIPRFMLFDTEGRIINLNAPRPSSQEIRPLIDSLLSLKLFTGINN